MSPFFDREAEYQVHRCNLPHRTQPAVIPQRIQKWLDAGYGSCILARPAIFRIVEDALKFFNGQRYLLGETPGE